MLQQEPVKPYHIQRINNRYAYKYNTYHAVQSLINPLAIVRVPTFVRNSFNSAKIRAKTGNAYRKSEFNAITSKQDKGEAIYLR